MVLGGCFLNEVVDVGERVGGGNEDGGEGRGKVRVCGQEGEIEEEEDETVFTAVVGEGEGSEA